MRYRSKLTLKIIGTTLLIMVIALAVWLMSGEGSTMAKITWGVTFAPTQAEYLGLDARQVFLALLDDMGVRNFRLMVPWNAVEERPGQYDWSAVDWMLDQASQRGAKITLALGRKLFRWPECHDPVWLKGLSEDQIETKVLQLLNAEVGHFKSYGNITAWQIENEPLLPFGGCQPAPTRRLFKKEVDLARSLDSRPLASTESGELSAWLDIGSQVDWLGVSLYRVTNNPFFGRFYYPFRPGFYQKKAQLTKAINRNLQKVYLSELQLEPWGNKPMMEMSLSEQFDRMDIERTRAIINFASHTGFENIYLWGVEWWYWLKERRGDDRFWELGKSLINKG